MSDACCGDAPKLVFACSGAADVGEIADAAARKVTREGVGKMFCLAGVGGRIRGITNITASAQRLVAIDGCALNCAANCLQQAGFSDFAHVRLVDLGLEKGKSDVTDEAVETAAASARQALA